MLARRICLQLRGGGGVWRISFYVPRIERRISFDYARVFAFEKESRGERNAGDNEFFIIFVDRIGGTSWVTREIIGSANFFPRLVVYRKIVGKNCFRGWTKGGKECLVFCDGFKRATIHVVSELFRTPDNC